MKKHKKIDYHHIINQFALAEKEGNRLRIGDLETSEWLQNESINQCDVMEISQLFDDPRICIIAQGKYKGFYIYSVQEEVCYQLVKGVAASISA